MCERDYFWNTKKNPVIIITHFLKITIKKRPTARPN